MLKASYEVLRPHAGHSFLLTSFDELAFTAPFHFHPEYELTLITGGQGTRYIGSHMADFQSGDLVLVGPHLPHCWKLTPPATRPAGAIVIQFAGDFLGKEFFSASELASIRRLLQNSRYGIRFPTEDDHLQEKIRDLTIEKNDFRRLIGFLDILQECSLWKNTILLDTRDISSTLNPADRERIHPVFAYMVENFRGSISLEKAAAIAGMTTHAFCRYFKKITRKTFMETVIGYRLDQATRLLIETNQPVSGICFECGFGDISHFYKMFRAKMKISPLHYRKKFMHGTGSRI